MALRRLDKFESAAVHEEVILRWDYIQAVALKPDAVSCLHDLHRGIPREKIDQHALVGGIKVLDKNECHTAIGRKRG